MVSVHEPRASSKLFGLEGKILGFTKTLDEIQIAEFPLGGGYDLLVAVE